MCGLSCQRVRPTTIAVFCVLLQYFLVWRHPLLQVLAACGAIRSKLWQLVASWSAAKHCMLWRHMQVDLYAACGAYMQFLLLLSATEVFAVVVASLEKCLCIWGEGEEEEDADEEAEEEAEEEDIRR